jgi:porin
VFLATTGAATIPAGAESPPLQWLTLDQTAPPAAQPSANNTGDWGGLRPQMDARGFTFAGLIQLDISRNFRGGVDTDSTPIRYLLDLNATVDTEKALRWHGGTFFLDFEAHDGPNASTTAVGDIQGFDGIDGFRFVQIFQLWYQQRLFDDKLRIKFGKIDANADFSVIDHGKEFLNSSMSYPVTIFPMVTYPDPAPGMEIFLEPDSHFYAGAGAFYSNSHQTFLNISGHPENIELTSGGLFLIAEAGCRWKLFSAGLPGHAAAGGWRHTGDFPRFEGRTEDGTGGVYALVDQTLVQFQNSSGSSGDIGAFLEYGWSDRSVNPIAQQFAGGIAATGAIPFRPRDILGIGADWSGLDDLPALPHAAEPAIETFYKFQLTRWASLKSDLQYVSHPGGRYRDALVGTVRLEVDF